MKYLFGLICLFAVQSVDRLYLWLSCLTLAPHDKYPTLDQKIEFRKRVFKIIMNIARLRPKPKEEDRKDETRRLKYLDESLREFAREENSKKK